MLLQQLTEIGRNENETVREFNTRFEKLLQRIPSNICPERDHLIFLYTKAFPGHWYALNNNNGYLDTIWAPFTGFMHHSWLSRPLRRNLEPLGGYSCIHKLH
jgi:hypothetical protein